MTDSDACSEFTPHEVRKFCNICLKTREDHPFSEEDAEDVKKLLKVFDDQSEIVPNAQYAWLPPGCPNNRVDEYFQKFPDDQVPRHQSEGQKNRLKRLAFQIPPSDVSVEKNRFAEPEFMAEMEDYIDKLETTVLRLGSVKEWSEGMQVQCPKCLLILQPNELVITTAENGGQVFHPACFICSQCQEILADLIHCSDVNGTVFCVRHYGNDNKKRCHTCDELIFSSQYALAGDKFYHKSHLQCFACQELLEGNRGFDKDGELYCSACYEKKFSKDCFKCEKRISLENRHILYENRNYHYDCFNCSRCNAPLPDCPFEVVGEEVLCQDCYNKEHAPRCTGCEATFDMEAKVVKYEEKIYHVTCFRCADCKEIIGTGSFVPNKDKGLAYCKDCHLRNFGVRCLRCNYTITDDRGVMYDKQPFHEDCFTCHKCSTKIASRPFKTVDKQWYCMGCYGREFCKQCHSCGEPILLGADEDVLFQFQDYQWHASCFICSECKNSLSDVPFVIQEKLMVCKTCINESKMDTENEESKKNADNDENNREEEPKKSREEVVS